MAIHYSPKKCEECNAEFEPVLVEVTLFGHSRSWIIDWRHTHETVYVFSEPSKHDFKAGA